MKTNQPVSTLPRRGASLHPELSLPVEHPVPGADAADDREPEPPRRLGGERFSGASSLQATMSASFRWLIEQNLTGSAYSPTTNGSTTSTTFNLGTGNANNTSGGADESFSFQQPILAGGSATINLIAMQNLLQQNNINIARIKGVMFRLLSLTNDPTINTNTNTSSKVCITNNGLTCPAPLYWGSGGSGLTLNITNAASGVINTVAINTNGSGYLPNTTFQVGVNQINGAAACISVNTNAAGIPTAATIANGGTGYIAANSVPTTELGSFWLQTGNAQLYIDVTAGGSGVSNAAKNVLIQNMDQVNPVTPEINVIGATT